MKPKLFRISTVPISLNILLKGQLSFLNRYFEVTAISGSGKDLDEVAQREKVKIHPIEMQRQISPFKDLVSLIKLYWYFKKERPDIIHSITPKAGLLSMVAGRLAGVPIRIHTFTGLVFPYRSGIMQKVLILMDRVLCHSATHIYPEGKGVKADLISYRITEKPLTIIGNGNVNGIDIAHFDTSFISDEAKLQLKKQLNISENDFVFVFVGRLVKDKGINELVSAFKTLKLSDSQTIKLLLVGPLEQELDPLSQNVLNEIGENPDIIPVGFQVDVRPYLAISDCLAFPSYREGFPNVVLQALAMELPALVSDINGCNEIVQNGVNGLIFPPKDAKALATAMEKILEKECYHHLKKNSRDSIMDFKQEMIWESLKKNYDDYLKLL